MRNSYAPDGASLAVHYRGPWRNGVRPANRESKGSSSVFSRLRSPVDSDKKDFVPMLAMRLPSGAAGARWSPSCNKAAFGPDIAMRFANTSDSF